MVRQRPPQRRRPLQEHPKQQPPRTALLPPMLSSSLLLLVSLALLVYPTPAAAFVPPNTPQRLQRQHRQPPRRTAAGALRATTTTGGSAAPTASSSGSGASDSSINAVPASSAPAATAAAASSLRVRRATRADLRRVATMQVMEYGGEGLAFMWHYLQELDRLQTSFWVDPEHHAMLVIEDTSAQAKTNPPSPQTSTVPFGALGALLLGDPTVVGFVDLDARDRRVDRSTPDPYLSDLIVDPVRRGQGLGRLLMAEAEAVARGWGFPAVYLKVRKSNVRGLALYGSLGYVVVKAAGEEGIYTMRKWVVEESEEQLEEERRLLAAAAAVMTPFFFDPQWSNIGKGEGEGEGGKVMVSQPAEEK